MKTNLVLMAVIILAGCASGTPAANTDLACKVVNNAGIKTITCPDGTTATLADGVNGTNGKDGTNGQPGANGANGANGINGKDGTSCSVHDNGNTTKTVACSDGTSAIVLDGANGTNGTNGANGTNGQVGPAGTNGVNGANGLGATVTPEPAGANCSAGGTKVQVGSGPPTYVCTGAKGANGTNGTNGLPGVAGPPGASCTVQSTPYGWSMLSCPDGTITTIFLPGSGTLAGDLVLYNLADQNNAVGYNIVAGNLYAGMVWNIFLPNLTEIQGQGQATNAGIDASGKQALKSINLPVLNTISDNGLAIVNNPLLTDLRMDMLTHVTGNFIISGNPLLPRCKATKILNRLVNFTGTWTISNNGSTDPSLCP